MTTAQKQFVRSVIAFRRDAALRSGIDVAQEWKYELARHSLVPRYLWNDVDRFLVAFALRQLRKVVQS